MKPPKSIEKLLPRLVCPLAGTPLRLATSAEFKRLKAAIDAGLMKDPDGDELTEIPTASLITTDGQTYYPVYADVFSLTPTSGLVLDRVG